MKPLMVLVESSKVSRTAVQSFPSLPMRSARIVVAVFCVALSRRRIPLPGSESVVVVENV
jgi:hypothetical protein